MVKKRKVNVTSIILSILVLIGLTHIAIHFLAFGTGINAIDNSFISGLAVGQNDVFENLRSSYSGLSLTSKIFIAGEWLLVLIIILVTLIKGKIALEKDISNIKTETKVRHKGKSSTDLDVLYDMLKKKKSLRISSIAKIFGVDKETATNWCSLLEQGNLAEIRYPTVGGPRVVVTQQQTNKK